MRVKRFYPTILCLLVVSIGYLNAQINGDFERWVEDSQGNGSLPGQYLRPGTQPSGWEASNVHQKVYIPTPVKEVLVTPDAGRDGGTSVRMENKFVGTTVFGQKVGSNAPAYITLGVPWAFAVMAIDKCDGGTVGGTSYSERPDSIVGYFKRSLGEDLSEDALILAYLWRGTSTSSVPVNPEGKLASTETAEVYDQERCVLSSSDGASLIGKAEYRISGNLEEWTRIAIPFEYYSSSTPEKLNVIISSANYYNRGAIGDGNVLWADDVELVYKTTVKQTKLSIPSLPHKCLYGDEVYFEPTSNDTETEIQISIEDPSVVTMEDGIMKFLRAGSTQVTVSQAGSRSFTGAETTITVTIEQVPLIVRLQDITTESDIEPVYSFLYEGLIDIDSDIAQSGPEQIFEIIPLAQAYTEEGGKVTFPAEVGTYTIKWLQKPVAHNYDITVDEAVKTLTVTEAKPKITISPVLDDITGDDITKDITTNLIWGEATEEGRLLTLKITATEEYSLEELVVKVNDEVVYPKTELLRSDSANELELELGYIKEDITLTIEGIKHKNATGITEINEGVNIYAYSGKLYIDSSKPGELSIYTLNGNKYIQRNVDAGLTSVSLPKGFYIVKVNDITRKVVVN